MQGQPTRLTEICQLLRDGRMTWPDAREEIIHFPFRQVEVSYPDDGFTGLPSFDYGTWDEVVQCYCRGLLTKEEYEELSDAFGDEDDDGYYEPW